jgi:peptidoglycan LD-endopeptidase LytH
MKLFFIRMLAAGMLALTAQAQPLELSWPTPHPAWAAGKPISAFLQDTGTGDPKSGSFGGVRTNGRQFHEGLDIKALQHDRHGEPADPVFAAMDGVVRYVNAVAGNSSYGRYVVVEHPSQSPAVYTLYAHLAKIEPGIRAGVAVRHGQTIALMGRSASGYAIPKQRAHVHFEIGLYLTRDFQSWYNWKKFGSRNEHGVYNGMNLMGIDPLDFFNAHRTRRINNVRDYFNQLSPVVKVRIATRQRPDFVDRYPGLVTKHLPMLIAGWEVEFTWTGLPFRWTPLDAADVQGMRNNEVKILSVDTGADTRDKSKRLAISRRGQWIMADDLQTVMQLLFGLR